MSADAGRGRRPQRSRMRLALAGLAVVAVAGLAVLAAFLYIGQQYFVAADADSVVVYRGVPGTFLGVTLHVDEADSGLRLVDLTPVARQQLSGEGIQVEDRAGADATVARLRSEQLLPLCEPVVPTPAPVPPAAPALPGAASPTVAGPAPVAAPATAEPQVPGRDCRQAP